MSGRTRAADGWMGRLRDMSYFAGEFVSVRLAGDRPPTGWRRLFFKFPIVLYRLGLGSLVGGNILLLGTTGRRTGLTRVTPLGYIHDAETDTYYLIAGWGARTDWFRNIGADPRVRIRAGRRQFGGIARVLQAAEAAGVIKRYIEKDPFAVRTLEHDSGIRYDGTVACLERIASRYGTVAVRPSSPQR